MAQMTKSMPVHPTLKDNEWVLYPYNHWVQKWDTMFLMILIYYAFAIPYIIGVSGGYHMLHQMGWLVVNFVINALYIIDTFMQFFRAYHDDEGMLVYELKKIARNYGCSGQFILNLLSCFPSQGLIYGMDRMVFGTETDVTDGSFIFYTLIDMTKLLRLTRVKSLAKSSTVHNFWEKQSIPNTMLAVFVGKMMLFCHWLACIWSFVAFVQARSYNFTDEGVPPTWISAWYKSSYTPGSIDPIGWGNDVDRYVLSLFWAIQSVTSIGYGNISPVSRAEFFIANVLMLVSGVFWAYAIGNIINILQHVNSSEEVYKKRMDSANVFINSFAPTDPNGGADYREGDSVTFAPTDSSRDPAYGVGDSDMLALRIRRFLTAQYNKTSRQHPNCDFNSKKLEEIFPVIEHFSPELRRFSSLHLHRGALETIPYLSSKYLSPSEQSEVAFKCVYLEFARGDTFYSHDIYGKGIMVMKTGFCTASRKSKPGQQRWYTRRKPIGINDVLVESDFIQRFEQRRLLFYSYSLVLYIPRSVILEVLEKRPDIWKDCARWRYLQACLLKRAREKRELP
mmetsp:Transcript_494/g.632  ORF Transcript_494/g.632 Transcript_494/m.632 type:complete len:564 (+) Transcript_494:215-1906(+)